jgi:hypothetical protein
MGCGTDEICPTDANCPTNADCLGHQDDCPGNIAVWTNDPLVAGTTLIRDVHVSELRTAINDERTDTGSPRRGAATSTACTSNTPGLYTFADDPLVVGTTLVRDDHINELADAINTTPFNVDGNTEGPNPAAVADPLVDDTVKISVGHIETLRDAINVVRSNCICDTYCSCNFNCPCDNVLVCICDTDIY